MCSQQHQETFEREEGQREKGKKKQKEKPVERDAVCTEASIAFVCAGVTVDSPGLEMRGGPPYGAWVVEAGRRGGLGLWSSVTQGAEGLRLAS